MRNSYYGLCVVLSVAGCTSANPNYQPPDAAVPGHDLTRVEGTKGKDYKIDRGKDVGRRDLAKDTLRPYDIAPWPDSVPWQCKGASDCDDKLSCTIDTCNAQKQCEHKIKASSCVIYLACYADGELNPLNSCEHCDSTSDPSSWTTASDGDSCDVDGLGCTQDVCKTGVCEHPLWPNTCLIDGACYNANATNPKQVCEACIPSTSTWSFSTRADNASCTSDGLSCTVDVCKGGVCTHDLGAGCLINGVCYNESQVVGNDTCTECVPSKSKTASTFIAGKGCASSGSTGLGAMCLQGKCMSWQETFFEASTGAPSATTTTILNGVDYVPSAKEVWAVGQYSSSLGSGGVLVPLSPSATKPLTTTAALNAISYRLAVGESGQAYYHDGTKWAPESAIETALDGANRLAVWGASASGADTFFIAGAQTNTYPAVVACAQGMSGFTCTDHTFSTNIQIGGIFGTLTGTGGQGPLWAARFGTNAPEDIYYNMGSGTTWTTSGPEGCLDTSGGSTPCSNTSNDARHMYGGSGSDIWIVGTTGMILHYNGVTWAKASPPSSATNYSLDAVYSSPADNLVTIPAHRDVTGGRAVVLYNYNSDLNRWFGPITVVQTAYAWSDGINDIGGQGYTNLWMVGQRTAGIPSRTQGWILQLK
jgi:hypothetical protein